MPGAPAARFLVQRISRAIFRDPCPVASNPLARSTVYHALPILAAFKVRQVALPASRG